MAPYFTSSKEQLCAMFLEAEEIFIYLATDHSRPFTDSPLKCVSVSVNILGFVSEICIGAVLVSFKTGITSIVRHQKCILHIVHALPRNTE